MNSEQAMKEAVINADDFGSPDVLPFTEDHPAVSIERESAPMPEVAKAEAARLLKSLTEAEKIHPAGSPEHAQFMQYALAVAWPRLRFVLQAAAD